MKKETIDIKNGSINVTDYSDDIKSATEEKIKDVLETIGSQAESFAKAKCPVDTGNLRNSISHAVEGETVYIGTDVFYAP
jgi:hypothetical protein